MADDQLASRVLELRRAGVGFSAIADQLKLADESVARELCEVAMRLADLRFERDLEVSRMDRLLQGIWTRAAKGDEAAIDRVLRISERRERLAAGPPTNDHALRLAVEQTIAASGQVVESLDAAAIAATLQLADRVDQARATGGMEETKALYLLPHLRNFLRELLATPAARLEAGLTEKKDDGGKLAQLRAVKGRAS